MTLLFYDGFDHYSTAELGDKYLSATGNITVNATEGRRGTGCYQVTDSFAVDYIIAPISGAKTTYIVGFALKVTNWGGHDMANHRYAMTPQFISDSGTELALRLNDDKKFEVIRGPAIAPPSAILATGTQVIQTNKWYYIEIKYFANDTTGTAEVRINNLVDIDFTGDTVGTSDQINRIDIGNSGGWSMAYYLDDFYICDDLGTEANDFLGDVKVETEFPTGAGANTQWTPTAGANWQCVDESTPNDDTDYVHTNISGYYDTYEFGNLTTISGEVFGVQINMYGKKPDAGTKYIRSAVRPTTTEYDGNLHSLGDSYGYFIDLYTTNPETTSGWTISEVNSGEFGIKSEG
jgi:hypothetical protein